MSEGSECSPVTLSEQWTSFLVTHDYKLVTFKLPATVRSSLREESKFFDMWTH